MNVQEELRNRRKENNLTQEQIAEKIYVSRQTISNWENGKSYPDLKSLILLSDIYNVSLDQLVRGDLDMMKKEVRKNQWTQQWKKLSYALLFFVIIFMASFMYKERLTEIFENIIYLIIVTSVIPMVYFSYKLEQIKKDKNIEKYKDILSFLNE